MCSQSEPSILQASLSDADSLHAIELACFTGGNAAERDAFLYRLKAFPRWFFKAEINGRIAGFVDGCSSKNKFITDDLYEAGSPFDEGAESALIFGLAVHPDFQKRGLARSLLSRFLLEAKERGKKRTALTCEERLVPFYEKFGFKNCGLSASAVGGIAYCDMEIALR